MKRADSYGSAAGLKRQSKLTKVNDFLMKQDAYTLHRNVRRRFRRRKTYVPGMDHLWQMDLVDLSSLSRHNDGYRYLLTCIDVFSKYGRVATLKTKTGVAVRDAFESMITDTKPLYVQTDKGTEFLNTNFQKLLIDNDIKHYTSQNEDIKCAVVERWNRTLMTKLHRYFTHKNTLRYLDIIQDLVHSYNNTYHSSIKMSPTQVDAKNERKVYKTLYPPTQRKKVRYKFSVGDTVRISSARIAFAKGYRQKWSEEIFKVVKLYPTDPPTYGLTDYDGESIAGKFYVEELQKVVKEEFRIEKVLKTRYRGKKADQRTEYYVKWLGYPDKFNSWVTDIKTLG